MTLVLDASMALAWIMERTEAGEALLAQQAARSVDGQGALVPALWFSEVTNGLLVAERRRAVSQAQTSAFQADLNSLPIEMDSLRPESAQPAVLAVGRQSELSAYDAAYLELALRRNAVLATFDRKLAEAARSAGVKVFGDTA